MELTEEVLDGLNPSQREAAAAVRGPVAILAGAGTGKTTTITHRIAYQVATQAFRSEEILAVTFTEKAAGELKARLKALGVDGVEARTFHSAALAQLLGSGPRTAGPSGDPGPQGPAHRLARERAAAAPQVPAPPRPRLGDRVGEEQDDPPERYLAELGDHETDRSPRI